MRISKGYNSKKSSSEDNPYWISFSDLMSALLVIFILSAVALIIELTQRTNEIDKSIKEIQKSEQIRFEVLQDIKSELEKTNIKVEISENHSVLRIPEETLSFTSGSEKISRDKHTQKIVIEIGSIKVTALNTSIQFLLRGTQIVILFIIGAKEIGGLALIEQFLCGNYGVKKLI
jgi:hypothetical protein